MSGSKERSKKSLNTESLKTIVKNSRIKVYFTSAHNYLAFTQENNADYLKNVTNVRLKLQLEVMGNMK